MTAHKLLDVVRAVAAEQARQSSATAAAIASYRARVVFFHIDDDRSAPPELIFQPRQVTTRQALDHLGTVVRDARELSDLDCMMLVSELGNCVEFIAAEHDRRYPGAEKPAKPRGDA
jgi:hypothetical protein